jgi:hypothetical protein
MFPTMYWLQMCCVLLNKLLYETNRESEREMANDHSHKSESANDEKSLQMKNV